MQRISARTRRSILSTRLRQAICLIVCPEEKDAVNSFQHVKSLEKDMKAKGPDLLHNCGENEVLSEQEE